MPNNFIFYAYDSIGTILFEETYYSVGGGFVQTASELASGISYSKLENTTPYPFKNASEMLEMCVSTGKSIAELKSEKEKEMLGKVNVFISNVNVFADAILASAPQVQKMDGESEAEMKNEVPLYKAEELTIQEKTKQPGCFAKLCCCFFGSNTPKKVRKLKEGNEQGQDLLAGDQRTSDAAPVKKAGGASQPAVQDQTVYTSLDGRM